MRLRCEDFLSYVGLMLVTPDRWRSEEFEPGRDACEGWMRVRIGPPLDETIFLEWHHRGYQVAAMFPDWVRRDMLAGSLPTEPVVVTYSPPDGSPSGLAIVMNSGFGDDVDEQFEPGRLSLRAAKVMSSATPSDETVPLEVVRAWFGRKSFLYSDEMVTKMQKAFLSYVVEDRRVVDRLAVDLGKRDVDTWRDHTDIGGGERWNEAIVSAIAGGAAFVACFSTTSAARPSSYMNEEVLLAIDELRKRRYDTPWFFPVLLDEGAEVPDISIRRGESLRDLQAVRLFPDWTEGVGRLAKAIKKARPTF